MYAGIAGAYKFDCNTVIVTAVIIAVMVAMMWSAKEGVRERHTAEKKRWHLKINTLV